MAQALLCSSPLPRLLSLSIGNTKEAISTCNLPCPAEIFAVARLLEAGGVLAAISDARGRHDVPVALPTTANAGDCHVDGLAACWGRLPAGTMRHCAIITLKRAGRRAIATARMPMNVKDADKTHIGAWDDVETAQKSQQNVPDDYA